MKLIEDNNAFLMAMGEGSRIEIHTASAAKDSWTQIDETVTTGDVTLTLAEDTGWQVGDKIAIAASGFDMQEAEERTVIAVSDDGLTVTLDTPLEHTHLGEIKAYDNGLTGEKFQSWDVDMRAEVALLSRNVTIQGDADSAEDGYGGHTMIMDGASMHIDGAELTRMGQEGEVGRYPLHWHMLGDASGQYITNSSIHETFNKGITIHGTQNTWVENLAIYNTIGHTYYFEDGSEFGNVVMNSLGMNTKAADSLEDAAIGSDFTQVSTYWVTNPANHLIDNHSAGSKDTGFWILSQDAVQGKSLESGLYDGYSPRFENPGQWTGNVSHSNADDGMWIGSEFDETDGSKNNEPKLEQAFLLSDFTTYSNEGWGIWQRNGNGDYDQIKIVESNAGVQMWGSSSVQDSLFVGRATNTDNPLEQYVGWQLYDNATTFSDVHFEGYTGENDAAISNGWGFGRSTIHSAEGLTFGEDGTQDNVFLYTLTNDGAGFVARTSDDGGPIAGGVIDIDGSLTGTAGAVITPGLIDYNPDQSVDVLTYADETIAASGFNWSAGATWSEDNRAWIHTADKVIGKMVVIQQTRDEIGALRDVTGDYVPDRVVYTIERSDNGAKIEINEDSMVTYAWHMQYNLDTSDGVEYIFDYSAETPDAIKFELTELPDGETAYYRFKGLPDGVVFQEADAAESIEAFNAAIGTTWIKDTNGDYLVKAVAEKIDYRDPIRNENDLATARVFTDNFSLIVQPLETDLPTGNDTFQRDLQTFVAASPDLLPERAESTSQTVEIADTDARWSDAASWGGDLPGVDDIVIIGVGQKMILDTFVKVGAVLVNGGELVVEDTKDLQLAADWILVTNGGLLQIGTEDTPFVHDFELTLEGDDAGNDVDVMALLASTDDNIVRAVENDPTTAPETMQKVVADSDDVKTWDYIKTTFDADGQRIAREVVNDDGRVTTTSYNDGVATERVSVDAEDAKDWDRVITTFDAGGSRLQNTQIYDDGRKGVTDYVDGVRAQRVLTDHEDTKPWNAITTTYSQTGDLVLNVSSYDNGRIGTTTYSDGVRSELVVEDAGNAFAWDRTTNSYDDTGVLQQRDVTFDDGRVTVTNYVDGIRSTYFNTDVENAKNWTEITKTFTEAGDPDTMVVTYDNGRVGTTTYTDGLRSNVIIEDLGDAYGWNTRETTYAANGARIETVQVSDNGAVATTQHVELVRAINTGGGDFTATNGLVYEADTFENGNAFGTGAAIAGTDNDGLYQINRWNTGEVSYEIAVDNGTYLLELNFAETFGGAQSPGQRVFDIYVEDELVFNDLDLAAEAGFETALDLLGNIEVADGALSLRLVGEMDNPNLAGLSIWTADGTGQDAFVFGSVADEFSFV